MGIFVRMGIAAVLALAAGTAPAMATGSIECEGIDGEEVFASILTTRAGAHMFMPLRGTFGAGERSWASEALPEASPAEPILLAHAYGDEHTIVAEYTDTNLEGPVISLRLARAAWEDFHALAGVLRIEGVGAWPVRCEVG